MKSLELNNNIIIKTCKRGFTYITFLLLILWTLWQFTVYTYVFADGNPIIVYVANIVVIAGFLLAENLENRFWEKHGHKLKGGGFFKRFLKKSLAKEAYRPSLKVSLYMYYLLCIVADRFLYFGAADNVMEKDLIAVYIDLFSKMYYSFIFLMALDKVKEAASKEHKHRKKYYAKYQED